MIKMYSIKDAKTGEFSTPFFQANDDTATRMFFDEVNRGEGLLSSHPGDFDLYRVGEFIPSSGKVLVADAVSDDPVLVVSGSSLKVA